MLPLYLKSELIIYPGYLFSQKRPLSILYSTHYSDRPSPLIASPPDYGKLFAVKTIKFYERECYNLSIITIRPIVIRQNFFGMFHYNGGEIIYIKGKNF